MKHLLLVMALTLVGCGGGSSTVVSEPISVVTPPVPVGIPEVIECPTVPDCPVCPEVPVVEPTIVTYYLLSTAVLGSGTETYTYDEKGNILTYTTDTYSQESTYDGNSNLLTTSDSEGKQEIYTYDDNNNVLTYDIGVAGTPKDSVLYTYDGNNLIKIEHLLYGSYITNMKYDENNNVIYRDELENGVLVSIETYTWQEFTEEIR